MRAHSNLVRTVQTCSALHISRCCRGTRVIMGLIFPEMDRIGRFRLGTRPECREASMRVCSPRKALRGVFKSQFLRDLFIFGDECPQNGSKNDKMAPRTTLRCPHEGPRVATVEAPAICALGDTVEIYLFEDAPHVFALGVSRLPSNSG